MKMKAPGVYVYASQSLMKGTYTASVQAFERELWGLWGATFASGVPWGPAEVQVQNQIRLQAFAGLWAEVQDHAGPWVQDQIQVRL